MPYIRDANRRRALDQGAVPRNVGELTYVLYRYALILVGSDVQLGESVRSTLTGFVHTYISEHLVKYQTFAEVLGALTATRYELWRRIDPEDGGNVVAVDGLLTDVTSDIYTRLIGVYEDLKIIENGDVTFDGDGLDELHVAALELAEETQQDTYIPDAANASVEGELYADEDADQERDRAAVGSIGPDGRS